MTQLSIIFSDNPLLRSKSRRVRNVTEETRQLVEDMFETMHAARGVGLAAVQVGVPLRIMVIEIPEDLDDPEVGRKLALIDPKIMRTSKETEESVEGCLSVPGWAGQVARHTSVTVKGLDLQGKPVRVKAEDYLARVIQHEIDHLDGILFIDRTDDLWSVEEGEEERLEAEAAAKRSAGEDDLRE